MVINFTPIGTVHTAARKLPRHWSVSDVEGTLDILPEYAEGLSDISAGQRIVVLFHFHKSPPFIPELLKQTPPHRNKA
ncbi:MAG: tRNA (N6-threonylcarbamoyladenosine(37)-N6)-methyltransferase TrmO, partial [Deltaproteobacteria bacterium]|nr:tRNA (N6-threonylcarbamoyladenosine(37)-N6)-methyltransferase TrmO [Deltaproteobacteria bacterium]